jgi:hypothetical protein
VGAYSRERADGVILDTSLPIDLCKDRLAHNIDAEKIGLSFSGYAGSRPILGRIDENNFRLQKRRCYRNPSAPFFFGRFVASAKGTRIEGSFQMHRFVKIFMGIWLSMLGMLSAANLISVIDGWAVFRTSMFAVPFGMAVFGLALVKVGQLLGRKEEAAIVKFLRDIFEADVIV